MSDTKIVHPAQYSAQVVDKIVERLVDLAIVGTVLDPFAGPGQSLHRFTAGSRRKVIGLDIQPEWVEVGNAAMNGTGRNVRLRVGDATRTRLKEGSVAAVVTSPAYGNRFSDAHAARDHSLRRSYTHDLRTMTGDPERQLAEGSSGALRFGSSEYAALHAKAYQEALRVTKVGGVFLLNVSDFIRNNAIVDAASWHVRQATVVGWCWRNAWPLETRRMRYGANRVRAMNEWLFEFVKVGA